MAICSAVLLMEKTLSLSARLIRAEISWILTGRSRAATAPQGRGVLCLLHLRLRLLASPQVVVVSRLQLLPPLAMKRTSKSSHRSSGCARRPCRTGGGLIFAGNPERRLFVRRRRHAAAAREEAGGAGEEASGASTNKSSFTLLLCH